LKEAAARRQEILTAQDTSEDATLADFKLWRAKNTIIDQNRPCSGIRQDWTDWHGCS
jgi:hypothetical protein